MKRILFIGLSDKKGVLPLQSGTKSGDIIDKIIKDLNEDCYKINLVNFVPLDDNNKLRYPNKVEMDKGYENLKEIINQIKPDLCVLLGNIVIKYLSPKLHNFIGIIHPSYIFVYKRKYIDSYINETVLQIKNKLNI